MDSLKEVLHYFRGDYWRRKEKSTSIFFGCSKSKFWETVLEGSLGDALSLQDFLNILNMLVGLVKANRNSPLVDICGLS